MSDRLIDGVQDLEPASDTQVTGKLSQRVFEPLLNEIMISSLDALLWARIDSACDQN